jgi:hypothetical protein
MSDRTLNYIVGGRYMLANLISNRLEFLTTTNQDRRLDVLMKSARDPITRLPLADLETLEAYQVDDRNRARALRKLKRKVWDDLPGRDSVRLVALLKNYRE